MSSTELGALAAVAVFCGAVRSDVELLAGDLEAAETTLLDQCKYFERTRNRIALAARAAKLAETLYRQERLDDAEHWAAVSRANAASDDYERAATPPAGRGEASSAAGLAVRCPSS